MNKRDRMDARIKRHGEQLAKIFPDATIRPRALCSYLQQKESMAHRFAEDYCNGQIDGEACSDKHAVILASVNFVLGNQDEKIRVIVNSDPRGYALKIHNKSMRDMDLVLHRDFGGYGILAPDLTDD